MTRKRGLALSLAVAPSQRSWRVGCEDDRRGLPGWSVALDGTDVVLQSRSQRPARRHTRHLLALASLYTTSVHCKGSHRENHDTTISDTDPARQRVAEDSHWHISKPQPPSPSPASTLASPPVPFVLLDSPCTAYDFGRKGRRLRRYFELR